MICSYGCNQPGIIKFDNGKWCCADHWSRCPGSRKRIKEYMLKSCYNSVKQRRERELKEGIYRCSYCGKVAKKWLPGDRFTCGETAHDCPKHSEFLSKKHKLKYKDNPKIKEDISKSLKIAQNRPDVKEAKRLRMIHLHNDSCDECKEFQEKFNRGHKKRRGPNYEQNKIYTDNHRRKKDV